MTAMGTSTTAHAQRGQGGIEAGVDEGRPEVGQQGMLVVVVRVGGAVVAGPRGQQRRHKRPHGVRMVWMVVVGMVVVEKGVG